MTKYKVIIQNIYTAKILNADDIDTTEKVANYIEKYLPKNSEVHFIIKNQNENVYWQGWTGGRSQFCLNVNNVHNVYTDKAGLIEELYKWEQFLNNSKDK